MDKKKLILIGIVAAVIIAWCATIFNLSGMSSENSNGKSKGIVEQAIVKVLDATNEAGITDSHPDDEKLAKAAELINAPLRKVVHATVYFVLALLLLTISRVIFGSKKYLLSCTITMLLCFIFAMTDEYHQTFVDGRTGQMMDVMIDTAGACVGMSLFSSYFMIYLLGFSHKCQLVHYSEKEKHAHTTKPQTD